LSFCLSVCFFSISAFATIVCKSSSKQVLLCLDIYHLSKEMIVIWIPMKVAKQKKKTPTFYTSFYLSFGLSTKYLICLSVSPCNRWSFIIYSTFVSNSLSPKVLFSSLFCALSCPRWYNKSTNLLFFLSADLFIFS
jgi:hypothetical protein